MYGLKLKEMIHSFHLRIQLCKLLNLHISNLHKRSYFVDNVIKMVNIYCAVQQICIKYIAICIETKPKVSTFRNHVLA